MDNSELENYVGFITEIVGTKVKARMLSNTNNLTYYRNGIIYKGVAIGEYVGIRRGPYKLVGKVEHEYLEDLEKDPDNQEFSPKRFLRNIDISIIGAFEGEKFKFGVSIFPQIFAEVSLLSSEEILQVLTGNFEKSKHDLVIGKTIPEGLEYSIDWSNFFNTHFAIFGNTGSGKSNTLAKLYTELFNIAEKNKWEINNSRFIFFDFNGEYTKNETFTKDKKVINLETSSELGKDKITLPRSEFWDPEMLDVLFSATKQTQEPFLKSTLKYFNPKENSFTVDKMIQYLVTAFKQVFLSTYKDPNTLQLLKIVLRDLNIVIPQQSEISYWLHASWNGTSKNYYFVTDPFYPGLFPQVSGYVNRRFFDSESISESDFETQVRSDLLESSKTVNEENLESSPLKLLSVFVHLQMIYKLSYGDNQFDYINPLLNRIDAKANMFDKVFAISEETNLTKPYCIVISFRNTNRDVKDTIPLLIAKYLYKFQKRKIQRSTAIETTTHLIIDEAHNILSAGNKREDDKWRDYRLDVFEEIIKEGRKFGFYLTIASQRPADISATIVSQMHNYIIHRLVNQNDLNMLGNTISSLDLVSQSNIPTLAPGVAIFTGTSFQFPVIVQVDILDNEKTPKSDNSDLPKIWKADN